MAIGAHPSGPSSQFEGHEVEAWAVESAIADFTGPVRANADALGHSKYEVSVGVEWSGAHALKVLTVGGHEKLPVGGHENAHSRPIRTAHWRTRKCPLAAMNLPRPV